MLCIFISYPCRLNLARMKKPHCYRVRPCCHWLLMWCAWLAMLVLVNTWVGHQGALLVCRHRNKLQYRVNIWWNKCPEHGEPCSQNMEKHSLCEPRLTLYIMDTLQFCINSKINTDNKTESLWVDIKERSQSVVLGLVYRPPNALQEINSLLWQEINGVRDSNFRNFDWSLMEGNTEAEEFLKVIRDNFFSNR